MFLVVPCPKHRVMCVLSRVRKPSPPCSVTEPIFRGEGDEPSKRKALIPQKPAVSCAGGGGGCGNDLLPPSPDIQAVLLYVSPALRLIKPRAWFCGSIIGRWLRRSVGCRWSGRWLRRSVGCRWSGRRVCSQPHRQIGQLREVEQVFCQFHVVVTSKCLHLSDHVSR